MATYNELFDLRRGNNDLLNRTAVAVTIKAQLLLDATTPTSNEVAWANNALTNPMETAEKLLNYVLAANNSATVGQITSATDATLQSNVDAAADALIAGGITE